MLRDLVAVLVGVNALGGAFNPIQVPEPGKGQVSLPDFAPPDAEYLDEEPMETDL